MERGCLMSLLLILLFLISISVCTGQSLSFNVTEGGSGLAFYSDGSIVRYKIPYNIGGGGGVVDLTQSASVLLKTTQTPQQVQYIATYSDVLTNAPIMVYSTAGSDDRGVQGPCFYKLYWSEITTNPTHELMFCDASLSASFFVHSVTNTLLVLKQDKTSDWLAFVAYSLEEGLNYEYLGVSWNDTELFARFSQAKSFQLISPDGRGAVGIDKNIHFDVYLMYEAGVVLKVTFDDIAPAESGSYARYPYKSETSPAVLPLWPGYLPDGAYMNSVAVLGNRFAVAVSRDSGGNSSSIRIYEEYENNRWGQLQELFPPATLGTAGSFDSVVMLPSGLVYAINKDCGCIFRIDISSGAWERLGSFSGAVSHSPNSISRADWVQSAYPSNDQIAISSRLPLIYLNGSIFYLEKPGYEIGCNVLDLATVGDWSNAIGKVVGTCENMVFQIGLVREQPEILPAGRALGNVFEILAIAPAVQSQRGQYWMATKDTEAKCLLVAGSGGGNWPSIRNYSNGDSFNDLDTHYFSIFYGNGFGTSPESASWERVYASSLVLSAVVVSPMGGSGAIMCFAEGSLTLVCLHQSTKAEVLRYASNRFMPPNGTITDMAWTLAPSPADSLMVVISEQAKLIVGISWSGKTGEVVPQFNLTMPTPPYRISSMGYVPNANVSSVFHIASKDTADITEVRVGFDSVTNKYTLLSTSLLRVYAPTAVSLLHMTPLAPGGVVPEIVDLSAKSTWGFYNPLVEPIFPSSITTATPEQTTLPSTTTVSGSPPQTATTSPVSTKGADGTGWAEMSTRDWLIIIIVLALLMLLCIIASAVYVSVKRKNSSKSRDPPYSSSFVGGSGSRNGTFTTSSILRSRNGKAKAGYAALDDSRYEFSNTRSAPSALEMEPIGSSVAASASTPTPPEQKRPGSKLPWFQSLFGSGNNNNSSQSPSAAAPAEGDWSRFAVDDENDERASSFCVPEVDRQQPSTSTPAPAAPTNQSPSQENTFIIDSRRRTVVINNQQRQVSDHDGLESQDITLKDVPLTDEASRKTN